MEATVMKVALRIDGGTYSQGEAVMDLAYGPTIRFEVDVDDTTYEGLMRPWGDMRWPVSWAGEPPKEVHEAVFWAVNNAMDSLSEPDVDEEGNEAEHHFTLRRLLEEIEYYFSDEVDARDELEE